MNRRVAVLLSLLLHFGVAKLVSPDDALATVDTGAGVLVGTLRYMSPEQLRREPAQPGWDLWALALVAYEVLAGSQPFPFTAAADWQAAVLEGRFVPITQRLPEAPARWQQFFERALAPEPQRRPESARAFLRELERALS